MTAPEVRPIEPADVPAVVAMVHELAAYERAPAECTLTDDQLAAALFAALLAARPTLYGHVALDGDGLPAGLALWFLNWNSPAHEFYRGMGAVPMREWTVWRLTGPALAGAATT